MQVLSVTPEIFPLIKTGGLADVTGALPVALAAKGVTMRTLIPGFPAVMEGFKKRKAVYQYPLLQGGKASIHAVQIAGLDLFVLDAPHLFDRPGGPYGNASGADWPDNWRRFAALSQAGADIAGGAISGYLPEIVHAHDWQSAMTLAYMRYGKAVGTPSMMTVHNLAFQGQFGAGIFGELGLPAVAMALDGVEYYGGVGFLKAGLQAAWAITTVSPTYAQEIRSPEFGMGLDGLINMRSSDLYGIVNGIDTAIWDPETDKHLVSNYTATTLKARAPNRAAVEERFGLDRDDSPIVCVISRLTWQKGMDILATVIDGIVATGARLAILGSGDAGLEGALLAAAARHRGRIGVVIGYDEGLSHTMQGGCDAIIIPSRFEPCGLTQLYGLRYGCVPVVARTGGLADTIIDANEAAMAAGVATGLQFAPNNGGAMLHAIRRLVDAYADPAAFETIQRQGMKADVSWDKSAEKYLELYRLLLSKRVA
ncbi:MULTISPECIES: glycogen synthase GlgA [Mesorhizobium]|uniref:Glycogen synthase n=5 Tax=Mesorhizobium TaxID=68287 RepID=GLGA_RHILO|nr:MULTISPECIES: glycogen synthase GlgA [Mesorhizobium]Q985P2.1 RecName: Full=Glycogen synthase; AltName: Full=Starch [bacterial glycogen] synthase [Mesorhizobium japonicum MAFF 303099]ETA72004.1 glycogen/starch synthase, ADP-glucose type [Mesorhizobium japonicum R7A]MBE1708842.1 glycogen synthase GlgA [Mesorhizobium japonicum]MBE1714012.1 glycogen synthase GlgA [Mesorhizobium japonicum]MUT20163.1 glycogen synthase GlgA [Mesorhizobium japonicum]MUT26133.1 glycogen synthase GlgA [Mesorhizobium